MILCFLPSTDFALRDQGKGARPLDGGHGDLRRRAGRQLPSRSSRRTRPPASWWWSVMAPGPTAQPAGTVNRAVTTAQFSNRRRDRGRHTRRRRRRGAGRPAPGERAALHCRVDADPTLHVRDFPLRDRHCSRTRRRRRNRATREAGPRRSATFTETRPVSRQERRGDPARQRSRAQGRVRRHRRAQRPHRFHPRGVRPRLASRVQSRHAPRRRQRAPRGAHGRATAADHHDPRQPAKAATRLDWTRSSTAPTTTARGSVAVLEIAEAFAERPRARSARCSSSGTPAKSRDCSARDWFTDHPTVPRDSIVAQLNIDMIGRGERDQT